MAGGLDPGGRRMSLGSSNPAKEHRGEDSGSTVRGQPATVPPGPRRRDLAVVFLKAGFAFGGGLGILAVLEDELVTKRRAVTPDEFLSTYGIARVIPAGTMTALAVAYGYRFAGLIGTFITLGALVLPAFLITLVLTIGYGTIRQGPILTILPVTLIPAALGLIVTAALRLGKHVYRISADPILAVGAFLAAVLFDINPTILLVGGGVVGIILFRKKRARS